MPWGGSQLGSLVLLGSLMQLQLSRQLGRGWIVQDGPHGQGVLFSLIISNPVQYSNFIFLSRGVRFKVYIMGTKSRVLCVVDCGAGAPPAQPNPEQDSEQAR